MNQTNVLWTCHKACKIEFNDCCYCLCSVCYASKVDENDKKQERVLKKSRKRRGGTRNFDDDVTLCNHGIDALFPDNILIYMLRDIIGSFYLLWISCAASTLLWLFQNTFLFLVVLINFPSITNTSQAITTITEFNLAGLMTRP